MNRLAGRIGWAWLGLGTVVLALLAGIWIGAHPENLPDPVRRALVRSDVVSPGSVTDEAATVIRDRYFRKPDAERLDDEAIRGMVRDLRKQHEDRFSHYFDPEQNRRLAESLDNRFTGVGMTVSQENQRGIEVVDVFRNSPAAEAGIESGDLVVTVDGDRIVGQKVDLVVAKVKGPEGTEVTLGVKSGGKGPTVEKTMVRRQIRVPVTTGWIRERDGLKLGYVALSTFSRGAAGQLRRTVQRQIDRGAEGLLLDLRGNGGGLLNQAVRTASIFLDRGELVVETRSRTEPARKYTASGDRIDTPPMVVLVDRSTASAAEILAAALQTDNAVPVVGTRTFGKGLYQQVIQLDNGGALDISVGEFFTADGVSLAGKGLKPDVPVAQPEDAARDIQLNRTFRVLADRVRQEGGN